MHYLFFYFGLSLLINSSHVHIGFIVKLDGHTPLAYIVFKIGMKNKQYGISFEVTTSLQTKLQFQNFLHALLS